jgi:hypothetical protein
MKTFRGQETYQLTGEAASRASGGVGAGKFQDKLRSVMRNRNINYLLAALGFFVVGIVMAQHHHAQTAVWMTLGVVFLIMGARKPPARG